MTGRERALIVSRQGLRGEAHGLVHDPVHFAKPQQRLLPTPRPPLAGGAANRLRLRFQSEFQLAAKFLFDLHTQAAYRAGSDNCGERG